jgi:Fe-S-cluster containining protein
MSSTSSAAEEQHEREDAFSSQLREAEIHGVQGILASDSSPKAVFRIINNASGLAEMAYENARESNAVPIACKEGCWWCCHQTVRITAPEAIRIAAFIRMMTDTVARDEMVEKLRELDKGTRGITPEARAKLHIPCAFLRDGSCGIYGVRPLACEWYTSYRVEDCIEGYRVGFMNADVYGDRARTLVYDAVRTGLVEGLTEALPGLDMAPLELTAAVADALSSPEAAAEWRAGGPVFEHAHLVTEPE